MYDRQVKDRTLTFCVSGQLWNRSLVMLDVETESLWSHLLGEAMRGSLQGSQLTALPADMVTWQAWRRTHPQTTVLNMSRTHRAYTREFYKQPDRFVIGLEASDGMRHCSFATLNQRPVLNALAGELPLLIVFDPASTSARVYSRKVDGRVLALEADGEGKLRDRQTGSTWDRASGRATSGPLAGRRLEPVLGIVSYARAWRVFHPDSREVVAE